MATIELTDEDIARASSIAKERIAQKHKDGNTHSYGGRGETRTPQVEYEQNLRGVLAEIGAAKATRSEFKDERQQYRTRKPDGICTYKGVEGMKYEVRSGSKAIAYRPLRDKKQKDEDLLVGVVDAAIAHTTFGEMKKLCDEHPEWKGPMPGAPYYNVPIKYFNPDFGDFGEDK